LASDAAVAIVTGAASGLGTAIATVLSQQGFQVVLADVDAEKGQQLADKLDSATFFKLDVSDTAGWKQLGEFVVGTFGQLDALVNNAAIYAPKAIVDETAEGFDRIFRINQLSVLLGMQTAVSLMSKDRGGSIINISSTGGLKGYPGTIAYASTKWAVRGMSKVAAVELAPLGIRVNSVHPGLCETPMAYENTPELLDGLRSSIPLGRLGNPLEIANAVAFLASPASSYISGIELTVDGAATV
jgi:3alpha(or 20beta)-hydroxysteroid dehydrogenase